MGKMVIVDYGMGNLRSVQKAFESVGKKPVISSNGSDIESADKLVLPGVGAFGAGIAELKQRKLDEPVIRFIKSGRLFLGICLGLQMLFTESEEDSRQKGLDVICGRVKRFPDKGLKIPHMGWNRIRKGSIEESVRGRAYTASAGPAKECPLLEDIPDGTYMYFVHSYYVEPEDKTITAAWSDYGIKFTSFICKDNIYAMQFHPEKSQEMGLKILTNFSQY